MKISHSQKHRNADYPELEEIHNPNSCTGQPQESLILTALSKPNCAARKKATQVAGIVITALLIYYSKGKHALIKCLST